MECWCRLCCAWLCPTAVRVNVESAHFVLGGFFLDTSQACSPQKRIPGCLLQQMPPLSLAIGIMLVHWHSTTFIVVVSFLVFTVWDFALQFQHDPESHTFVIACPPPQLCSFLQDHRAFLRLLQLVKLLVFTSNTRSSPCFHRSWPHSARPRLARISVLFVVGCVPHWCGCGQD